MHYEELFDHFAIGLDRIRFNNDILCAQLQAFLVEVLYLVGGVNDGRDPAIAGAFLQEDEAFLSGHLWHVLIEDDHLRQMFPGHLIQQRYHFQAVFRGDDVRFGIYFMEDLFEDLAVIGVVIYQDYFFILQHVLLLMFNGSGGHLFYRL